MSPSRLVCLRAKLTLHSMFFQLLYIHLFRPFLKYTQQTSPLPANVSPRKLCTQAAGMISKLMRLYKRSHGLRQICNLAVYIIHSAATIHLLNLPDKNAKRDIAYGVKHLEEIAEGWLCARRTLAILSILARKWNVQLPEEAATVLARTDAKFGSYASDIQSPPQRQASENPINTTQLATRGWQNPATMPATSTASSFFINPTAAAAPLQATNGSVATALVRPQSSTHSLSPNDAKGLPAKQYPGAAPTPQAQTQGHTRDTGSRGTTAAASPSDMFGGVEQLIRDSQDWVYRDQAQIASGFGNWGGAGLDMDAWGMNGLIGGSGVNNDLVASTNMSIPAMTSTGYASTPVQGQQDQMTNCANGCGNGYGMSTWLNGVNPYNSYNEEEWYQ